MADNNTKNDKKNSGFMDTINSVFNRIYNRTTFSNSDTNDELSSLEDRVNKSIEKISRDSYNAVGLENISSLFTKVFNVKNGHSGTVDDFLNIFGDIGSDANLTEAFYGNRNLKQVDGEIDLVCKYMPKLKETVNVKVDNILSSDHFTKNYVKYSETGNIVNSSEVEFDYKFKKLTRKYNLPKVFKENLLETLKYGESFVYCIPYKKAISRLYSQSGSTSLSESVNISDLVLNETKSDMDINPKQKNINDKIEKIDLKLEFNISSILEDEVKEFKNAYDRLTLIKESALNESTDVEEMNKQNKKISNGITPSSKLDTTDFYDKDGFNDTSKSKNQDMQLNVNGCLYKRLTRYNVIPIYVDEICLGYYYIENKNLFDNIYTDDLVRDSLTPLNTLGVASQDDDQMIKNAGKIDDSIIRALANQMSQAIDKRFINMNKNFTREIYAILKASDVGNHRGNRFKVTFLPPDDVIHCFFEQDKQSHRGISSLQNALVPAKLWVGLMLSTIIGQMTRGQDRRVAYVKNSGIDTNVSRVLLTTMKQLKMNNMNIRQFDNLKNVLNIIGKYNDFLIPVSANGDRPVEFEIMQGQQIDPQTDLLTQLEEQAINSTDVPLEIIQSRFSADYAIQASMSNSRFLKHVYNWQTIANTWLSKIVSLIYRAEYDDTTAFVNIELPQPSFLNITNTNQLMDNASQLAATVAEISSNGMNDDEKTMFSNNLRKEYINPYIDQTMVQRVYDKTKLEYAKQQTSTDGGSSDSGDTGY